MGKNPQDTDAHHHQLCPDPTIYPKLAQEVTVTSDIMFVNGMKFLTIISIDIKFTTAEHMKGITNPVLLKFIKNIVNVYRWGGFVVDKLFMNT